MNNMLISSKKKQNRQERIIIFEAILLTVLFHYLLYYIFILPKVEKKNEIQVFHGISVINLNKAENQDYLPLLKYADPTLISKPNRKFGYSSICEIDKYVQPDHLPTDYSSFLLKLTKKLQPFFPGKMVSQNYKRDDISAPALLDYHIDNTATDKKSLLHTPTTNRNNIDKKKTATKYPLCISPNGRNYNIFDDSFKISSFTEKAKPKRETIMKISFIDSKDMPTIIITQSCGILALDKTAYKNLLINHKKLDFNTDKYPDETTIIIKWTATP